VFGDAPGQLPEASRESTGAGGIWARVLTCAAGPIGFNRCTKGCRHASRGSVGAATAGGNCTDVASALGSRGAISGGHLRRAGLAAGTANARR
jgi:hypothetical protein